VRSAARAVGPRAISILHESERNLFMRRILGPRVLLVAAGLLMTLPLTSGEMHG